jgi:diadenosine tetraphosphatase ApaH/serine/threonine PP2A family protein phosphatase
VFECSETDGCLVSEFVADSELTLAKNRLIINPGGVGQPRDGNPKASYAIYDSEARSVTLYRVPYDIRATQARMVKQRLPMRLVVRLSYGV